MPDAPESKSYRYLALKIQQQPRSPIMYVTSASAGEILRWCDVPRGRGDYMAGYQRPLEDKRTSSITEYLDKSPANLIPGAVVIAASTDFLEIDNDGELATITIKEDNRPFQEKLVEFQKDFVARLSAEELASATSPTREESGDDDEEETDDSEYPASYLAALAQELIQAVEDWESLEEERRQAITDFINAASKPGLIIDGQHRVFGAKDVSATDIHLPIVLVPGLQYSEQVFQFYVLNSKSRPLKPTQLRRIVSTSLTNKEIEQLYARFRQAGVEADEARWTFEMNTNPRSPFRDRIDFGFGAPGAVIKESVADQVVRGFMLMPRSHFKMLINPLEEDWADAEWRLERFFDFWNSVKENYADAWREAEQDAEEGRLHQLFMKVSLLTLQRFLLDRFVTALPFLRTSPSKGVPLRDAETIRETVDSVLIYLPQEFFQREWKPKQLDTSEGRRELYDNMEKAWSNQGRNIGNMKLFRTRYS